jgi:hypothetical protein
MSIKMVTVRKIILATFCGATLSTGLLVPTAGAAAGVATYYLAHPKPAQCDGTCIPFAAYICGLNGTNYMDYKLE